MKQVNKTSHGRPPLSKLYHRIRCQYAWFDFLKANRHIYAFRQMEKEAWAHWRPILKGLHGLKEHHADLKRRTEKWRAEHGQLSLSLDVTTKEE